MPENTPAGTNIGSPIAAEDDDEATLEYGDTLTYSLEATASTNDARADAAHFDIDKYTGQLITKGALDLESEASYSVRVRVTDSREATATTDVQISVTGENEPPDAPTMPTVVSGRDETGTNDDESTTTIKVIWHAPENVGRPDINSYDLQYKESAEQDFLPASPINTTDTNYTIEGLAPGTSYQVRVRAKNADGDSPWSLVGAGSTNKGGNRAPVSNEQNPPSDLRVPENAEPGHNVEGPVAATDGDSARLTYSLEGPDADSFDFDTSSGQIRTKRGVTYDHETKTMYFVTVVVVDGAGGSEATPVEIEVDDISERAAAPARPTVRPTDESSSSIDVSWTAPENTGPAIPGYEVRYRTGNENFSPDNCGQTGVGNCNLVTGTTATIVGLQPNTTYEVQVRAGNGGEGFGDWSVSGTGRTSKANQEPIFDDRPDGSDRNSELSVTRTVKENTRAGQLVGTVRADDGDGDRLTYIFDGSR